MRSAYFVEKNKMEVREFPKAQLVKETDRSEERRVGKEC